MTFETQLPGRPPGSGRRLSEACHLIHQCEALQTGLEASDVLSGENPLTCHEACSRKRACMTWATLSASNSNTPEPSMLFGLNEA